MANPNQVNDLQRDAAAAADEARSDLREGANKIRDDIRETAQNIRENASTERLMEKGAGLVNEAAEAGREYADRARATGREYTDRARAEADRLYAKGQHIAEDAGAYAELQYDEVSNMVRRNPAQALGIAAGVGFLVGLLISRR
ncbi:DUF883 domain-containing protein [Paracoccus sp. PARArs4]|uniref:DUF883 family protein n=1 Tax=Paracoccus sp. PARArs4 TaxID=2853442 RepID=UPI0024A6A181|nr:DUF883 domain-containing protein [Paracoccus sp. PARArs4]